MKFTLHHVHGIRGCTVASVTYSPHRVSVSTHTVNRLHEGSVEAHHPGVTWEAQSRRSVLIQTVEHYAQMIKHGHLNLLFDI